MRISILLISVILFTSCKKYSAGDICSVKDEDQKFGVVKVLVVEPEVVHLRIYENKFKERPVNVDLKSLQLGKLGDPDGFGIGHVPIDPKEFESWNPEKITNQEVTKEELEGYNIYKNQ